jgi:hypothetical protein
MKRLMEKMVFSGLVIACRFAGSPTLRSPPSIKATMEGVVLFPSLFVITTGSLPSSTATHELVVPKSIPIIFPMFIYFNCFPFLLLSLYRSIFNLQPEEAVEYYLANGMPNLFAANKKITADIMPVKKAPIFFV